MIPDLSGQPLYEVSGLRRVYARGSVEVAAVDEVNLSINEGEFLAIEGSSGSGKSTLLALLGGLERPSHGSICFEGREIASMNDRELTALRASEIGFIFQGFNLIPTLTARQNVEAVMAPLHLSAHDQRVRAIELLTRVGLGTRADHLPSTMSGGEQQRVAVARALANGPRVVLADEPTGNLDSATAAEVVKLLRSLTDDLGVTIILVTHDRELARQAPRRIEMRDGRVVGAHTTLPATPVLPFVAPMPRLAVVPDEEGTSPPRLTDSRTAINSGRAALVIGRAAAVIALAGSGVVAVHHAANSSTTPSANVATGPAQSQINNLIGGRSLVATGDPEPTAAAKKTVKSSTKKPKAAAPVAPVPVPAVAPAPLVNTVVSKVVSKAVGTVTDMSGIGAAGGTPTAKPKPTPTPVIDNPAPTPTPTTPASVYNPFWPYGSTGTRTWWYPTGTQIGSGG